VIVGIGLDIVPTERLARALEGFQERVFTAAELAACAGRVDRTQALAARFAAKEACFKALGAGVLEGALHEVEVVSAEGGAPQLRLAGALARRARARGVSHAHVSLTHEPGLAAAVVILESASPRRRAPAPPARRPETWTLETVSSGTW